MVVAKQHGLAVVSSGVCMPEALQQVLAQVSQHSMGRLEAEVGRMRRGKVRDWDGEGVNQGWERGGISCNILSPSWP